MTPPFLLAGEKVEIEHAEDVGSVAELDVEEAARWLARELVEVA